MGSTGAPPAAWQGPGIEEVQNRSQSTFLRPLRVQTSGAGSDHPNVVIDLTECTNDDVVAAVMDGRVELGILFDRPDNPDFVAYPYYRDSLCLVVPVNHSLSKLKQVSFAETLSYEYIAPGRQSAVMQTMLAHSSGKLQTRIHVRSNDALCRMVGADLGIGICQSEAAHQYRRREEIRCVALVDSWAQRQWLIGLRGGEERLSGAAQLFLKHLRDSAMKAESQAPNGHESVSHSRLTTGFSA